MKSLAKILSIAAAGAAALVMLPIGAIASGTSHTGCHFHVRPSQEVATLFADRKTYRKPGGRQKGSVSAHRPITDERTVLPVLGTKVLGHTTWLLVRLPGRPNSHTGWIYANHTREGQITWHIVVSTGERRACIYNQGRLIRDWLVVPGKPSTPTPHGQFFVEENVDERTPPNKPCFPGEPYALATSARSDIFTEFYGGPGQTALHGMGCGLRAKPGTAASHGCVRFLNWEITWLAARIYPGTPVTLSN